MNEQTIGRREFLSWSAAVTAGLNLACTRGGALRAKGVKMLPPEGNTYPILGYKHLILDYHFSEFHPDTLKRANAKEIIETVTRLGIDTLVLYGKDCWGNCYFKTERFHRHRNVPQDLFGEVLEGMRAHGIKVIAYYSVGWDEQASRNHADWMRRDAHGEPYKLTPPRLTLAKWYYLCLHSPYRDYSLGQLDELIGQYKFDGLFLDIFFPFPPCYCHYCKDLWKARYGEAVPSTLSSADDLRYKEFFREVTFRPYFRDILQIIDKHGRKLLVTHNAGVTYDYDDFLASETSPHGENFYRTGLETKVLRAQASGKQIEIIAYRGNDILDFTVRPVAALQWEVATGVGHNSSVMFIDQPFNDGSLDPVVYKRLHAAYAVADDLAPIVRGTVPYAEALLLICDASTTLYRPRGGHRRDKGERVDLDGAYKIMNDLHWPCDVGLAEHIARIDLNRYGLVILPFSHYLPVEAVERLRAYVAEGGVLIYCYRTGEIDPELKPLATRWLGFVELADDLDHQISFVRPRIDVDQTYLEVAEFAAIKRRDASDVVATLTPPALAVDEKQWITNNITPGNDTDDPALVIGNHGKGTWIYSPFRLFKEHSLLGTAVHRDLLVRLLKDRFATSLRVEAPMAVDAIYNRIGDQVRIVLVNGLTNRPAGTGNFVTIDEVVPIHGVSVLSRTRVLEAHNMRGQPLPIYKAEDEWRVELGPLGLYDAVILRREQ